MALDAARTKATRQALLEAAATLIAARGIGHTSHDDIGRLAGLSRGAVTYQYGSKDAFLQDLCRHAIQTFTDQFPRTHEMADASLEAVLTAYVAPLIVAPNRSRLLIVLAFEASGPHRSLAPTMCAARVALHEHCTALITRLQAQGQISPCADPPQAAQFAIDGFVGVMLQSSFEATASLPEQFDQFQHILKAHLSQDEPSSKRKQRRAAAGTAAPFTQLSVPED